MIYNHLLFIFIFYLIHYSNETKYQLIDINYNYPYCNLTKVISIDNNYGNIVIESNQYLINDMRFIFNFTNGVRSCEFCDLNKNYCNSIISINNIKLLNELKIIWIKETTINNDDDDDDIEYILFNNFQLINSNEIIFNNLTFFQNINCSKPLKLIILPTIKIIYPFGKNINLITIDLEEEEEVSSNTILCNPSIASLININCSIIKRLYFIDYFNPNCIKPIIFNSINITPTDQSLLLNKQYINRSNYSNGINSISLYWYYQFLNNSIYPTYYNNLILCGKRWKDLFLYSNLTFICNHNNNNDDDDNIMYSYYIELKPLYKLIIQYITTSLTLINTSSINNDRVEINEVLYLTLNIIENNCYKKEEERNLTEIQLFNNILNILTTFNHNNDNEEEEEEKDIYCKLIYNHSNYIKDNSKWVPNYITYRNEWFFILFKYFLLHNDNMYLYSIVLSSSLLSIFIIGLVLYLSIIIIVCKRVVKNHNINKSIYVV